MFSIYFPPHPALSEFVEIICVMGHDFSTSDFISPIYTFMPSHTRYLCFYLEDCIAVKRHDGYFETRSRALIIGPQITPVTMDLGKKHAQIIVILKPCGLYRLLGIPLRELVDCDFDARLVLGKEIDELLERLLNTSDNSVRNSIIQEYLLTKLSNLKPLLAIDSAMLQLVRSQGNLSMDLLAASSCLSTRQLERQSLERIGLPPKFFARMIRFSEAYKFKERNPHISWTKIAYQFGYYDQMHLIRDFRNFTGITPSIMKEQEIEHSIKFNSMDL